MVAINVSKLAPGGAGSKERSSSTLELMKASSRWLVWKYGPIEAASTNPKRPKKPHYLDGAPREGKLDTPEDRGRLGTYAEATRRVNVLNNAEPGIWSLGFALGPDEGGGFWQGYDKDGSKAGLDDEKEGYVELSPSKAGYHVVGYGRPFRSFVHGNEELYSHGRFFTFTGDQVKDGPVVDLFERAGGVPPAEHLDEVPREATRLSPNDLRALRSALTHLDPDPYDVWYRVALALRPVVNAQEAFLEWSRGSGKHRDKNAKRKLDGAMPFMPWQSVLAMAKEAGWKQEKMGPEPVEFLPRVILDPSVPVPTEFVLDGFVKVGAMVFVGHPGVGKTSILVPLTLGVAGLVRGLMKPRIRRKIIYITEDPDQIRQIVRGLHLAGLMIKPKEELNEWFRLFPSVRAAPELWEDRLKDEVSECIVSTDLGFGVFEAQPLIVLDTTSATIDLESENDNAAVSRAVAALRKGAGSASCWFVTHAAKSQDRDDPETLSARGAGAWTGDTQGEVHIISSKADPSARWLTLGKARFAPDFKEVKVTVDESEEKINTKWGVQTVRHRVVSGFEASSAEERQEEAERRKGEARAGARPARIMTMMKRFETRLTAESLSIQTGPGRHKVPDGFVPLSIRSELDPTVAKDTELGRLFLEEIIKKYKPIQDGGLLLFKRLTMEVGHVG